MSATVAVSDQAIIHPEHMHAHTGGHWGPNLEPVGIAEYLAGALGDSTEGGT
jgi:hypothetical protein